MNILTSLTYYLPNISGVTIYADILARYLAKKHKVTILTSRHQKDLPPNETKDNLMIKRLWAPVKISKGIIIPFFPIFALYEVIKTDLVICHLPQVEAVFLALWAKVFKKPIILFHHCEIAASTGLTGKIIRFVTYPSHLLSYALADKVVAHTKDYAKHSFFQKKFKNKMTFVLPPVILDKKDDEQIKKIAKTFGKNKNTKIIGFVGRIGWEKGIDILLKTIPILKRKIGNFKIVLVGPYKNIPGDKTYLKLQPLIENYKNQVIFTGPINRRKLTSYYYNFDCLVLPSISNLESFGIVQPEAMLCSCPVVASNLPGVRMPIKLTKMGKITPINNSGKLAENIISVLKRKNWKKEQKKAEKIFDKKIFFKKWQSLISKTKTKS